MKTLKMLLIGSLLAGTATAAFAVDANCPIGPMGEQGWHAERGWQRMDPAKRDTFIAQRQKALHDKLKIQPKQEAAWKAYTESMKPGQMMPPPAANPAAKAPERMEQQIKLMGAHQEAMQKHLEAFKTFYNQLTPEQQKIMDSDAARMAGPRGRMGRQFPNQPTK